MKLVQFVVTGSFLVLCSCATNPYFVLKNHHFDTSETRGEKFKFSASLAGYQDITTVVATVDAATATPTLQGWEMVKNDGNDDDRSLSGGRDHASLIFALSLHEKLDLSLDIPVGDQPTYIMAKYQFLGESRKDAGEGSFSASAFAGVGLITVETKDSFLLGGFTDEAKVNGHAFRGGASLGIRTNPELLLYWSNSYAKFFSDMEYIRQSGGMQNVSKFKLNGSQFLSMVGLQYIFDNKVVANVEYGFVFADSDETEQERFTSLGLNLGYLF